MSVKQSDIAKKLGISRVTVTKALQNSSDISVATKTKVRRVAIDSDGGLRLNGFLDTMKKYNLEINKNWIIQGKFFSEYGYKGFNKIYDSKIFPEVIFCGNGMIARGVYEAAREKNVKIPEDIGVTAIDHKLYADMLYPKLTHVNYPTDELGKEAMGLLIRKIESEEENKNCESIVLESTLIENESVLY